MKLKYWIITAIVGGTVLASGLGGETVPLGEIATSTPAIIDYTDQDNLRASTTIQAMLNTIFNSIKLIQDDYFFKNKRYLNCLTTSSVVPQNGELKPPELLDQKTDCQKESLQDLGFTFPSGLPFKVDIFENKTQVGNEIISGFQVIYTIEISGKKYMKSINTGAETYKNYDWKIY